jgi:hypothetical protein
MGGNSDNGAAPAETHGKKRGRKGRRWLRWLIVLLVLLAALVVAAPYLASTRPAVGLILPYVNDQIRGRIDLDELSLGWGGPTRLAGLRVEDPNGREVLRAESVSLARGLWGLLTGPESFGLIEIDSPHVVLYRRPDGGTSLAEAFQPRKPSPPSAEPAELPKPVGRIRLRGGSIRVVEPDGRRLDVSRLDTELELKTLREVTGSAAIELAGGGKLSADLKLTGLTEGGKLQPGKATGTVSVRTDQDVALKPLSRFGLGEAGLGGSVRLTADVTLQGGRVEGRFDLHAAKLEAGRGGREEIRPLDLHLVGQSTVTDKEVTGRVSLTGEIGKVAGRFRLVPPEKPLEISASQVIAALLTGERISLPEFTLDANGQVDLPRLARAVPALLRLRPDVAVTGGTVRMTDVSVRGGAKPAARGAIALGDFAARRGEQAIGWQPVSVRFDAELVPGEGLRLRDTHLASDFGRVDANGTPARLRAVYRADLTKLRAQLGEVFEMGELRLAGDLTGSTDLRMVGKKRVDLAMSATGRSLLYQQGDRKLSVALGKLACDGRLLWKDAKQMRFVATRASVEADDDLRVTATANVELPAGAVSADVQVERAVLSGLLDRARGLGAGDLPRITGSAGGKLSLARKAEDAPWASTGALTLGALSVDGNAVSKQDVVVRWTDASARLDAGAVVVAEADVRSDLGTVTVRQLRLGTGEELQLDGKVGVTADLARCAELAARLGGRKQPPDVAGRLTWNGTAGTDPRGIALDGQGNIEGFRAGKGKQAIGPERVRFDQKVRLDPKRRRVDIERLELNSDVLSLKAAGTVRKYDTEKLLDLSGRYSGSWERLTTLLHAFVPAAEDLALTGPIESDFTLTGPASQPKLRPVYRGVGAKTAVGWDTARAAGFTLGKARLPVELKDGRMVVPVTAVEAGGGKIRLGGVVDLEPDEPIWRLAGETVVLENVEVNREVGQKLLSHFNPIFAQLASLEGKITLSTRDLHLPFGESMKKLARGSGQLDLTAVKVRPSGLLTGLLELGGVRGEQLRALDVRRVNFQIRDGGIRYDNFTMAFDETFDLRFHGLVRFDDTLDMGVSVPVRSALLRKMGVRGRVDDYARLLEGARVEIPLLGTRLEPRMDLTKVDVRPLVQKAVQELLKKEAGGLLRDVLKDRGKTAPKLPVPTQPAPRPGPTTRPAPKDPGEQLLRDIFRLLDDAAKDKKSRS